MMRIRGSYALAVMFQSHPGELYVARKDSPMIIGVKDGESFIASDVPAILKYTPHRLLYRQHGDRPAPEGGSHLL